jgi:hypothetical protein
VGQWVMVYQFNFIRQVNPKIWDTHDSGNDCGPWIIF